MFRQIRQLLTPAARAPERSFLRRKVARRPRTMCLPLLAGLHFAAVSDTLQSNCRRGRQPIQIPPPTLAATLVIACTWRQAVWWELPRRLLPAGWWRACCSGSSDKIPTTIVVSVGLLVGTPVPAAFVPPCAHAEPFRSMLCGMNRRFRGQAARQPPGFADQPRVHDHGRVQGGCRDQVARRRTDRFL